MLSRSQDLQAQADLQIADSRVVSPALPPARPSFPDVPLILGLAGVMALGSGVGIGFLFENFVGGFTGEAQVEAVTKRKLAAGVPRQRSAIGAASLADASIDTPLSCFAESIRRIRAAVDRTTGTWNFANRDRPETGKVIMVSSALPSEGKTTLALALARTYALAGQKTVILDCDFRKPSVHRHLGYQPATGLVELLSGEMTPRDFAGIVKTDPKSPVTAILGAHRADLPTDQLVTRQSFSRLIEALRRDFDVIVMDTPPIEPVIDGTYLAGYADAIVFAIAWAKTPQRVVASSLEALEAAKAPEAPILAVLNKQDGKATNYGSARYYAG